MSAPPGPAGGPILPFAYISTGKTIGDKPEDRRRVAAHGLFVVLQQLLLPGLPKRAGGWIEALPFLAIP
jgi:hypothetical protein